MVFRIKEPGAKVLIASEVSLLLEAFRGQRQEICVCILT